MKKILLIGHTMARGGASHVLTLLANGFANMGYNVDLLFFRIREKYTISENVRVVSLFDSNANPSLFKSLLAVKRYLKENEYDVVLSFLLNVNLLVLICRSKTKHPRLIISERNDPKKASNKFLFILSKYLYKKAEKVVFQTKRVQSYYSSEIINKSTIILNPISVEAEQKEIADSKEIVSVGKLYPQKNHELLINAFKIVHEEFPMYVLKIYGEGPLRSKLQTQINDLNLSECVFLEGNRNNVQSLIANAEMFVLSSDYEGLSNALLEAMAIGIPSISTACAGSDEIIMDQENGLLVPVNDYNELSKAMIKLIRDRNLRERIQKNSKKIRELVKDSNVIRQWIELVQEK